MLRNRNSYPRGMEFRLRRFRKCSDQDWQDGSARVFDPVLIMPNTVTLLIRNAIVAKLNTVANIGRVHAYERYANQLADLSALYAWNPGGGPAQLRGWFVRRIGIRETHPSESLFREDITWQIRGYMALSDAAESELSFDALIDAIRAAFRADDTLGGAVDTCWINEEVGIQLDDAGPVLFANVLCHSARLTLMTRRHF